MMSLAYGARGRWGFALVELLLSITILVIILGITMPFLVAAERGWRQSQSTLGALQNARMAATTISEGLRRAVAIAYIGGGQPAQEITFDVDEWTFGSDPETWHGSVARTIRTTYKTVTEDGKTWAQLSEEDPDTGEVQSAVVAGPLENLRFVGYREDGVTTTTDPLQIRSVEVTVAVESPGSPNGQIEYSTRVLCRCDTTPAFAILSTATPSISLQNATRVLGDMFVGGQRGDVSIPRGSSVLDGRVYATGTVSGAGTYQKGRLWAPNPTLPTLDRSYYDGLLTQAAQRPQWSLQIRGAGSYGDTSYYQGLLTQAGQTSPWNLEVRAGNQYDYPLAGGQPDPIDYSQLLAAADARPRWDLEIRAGGTYGDTATYQNLLDQAAGQPGGNMEISGTFTFPPGRVLVNGEVKIKENAVLQGPGSLIATKRIEIAKNVTINGACELVSGQTIESSGSLRGSGTTLMYAFQAPGAPPKANLYLAEAPLVSVGSASVRAFVTKGDIRLRGGAVVGGPGFLVARREGDLAAASAVGGNVYIQNTTQLASGVSVLASDAIQCAGTVGGSGDTLLYAFKNATLDLSVGPLLLKGNGWLRGATVVTGSGSLVAGGNGDVTVDNNTALQNNVNVVAGRSATVRSSVSGTGQTLVYGFRDAFLDLTAGTLLVRGNFWARSGSSTTTRAMVIRGPGTLVTAGSIDVDNAVRITQNVTLIGNSQVELTGYVVAEPETILYSPNWTDLDGYATLEGAMVSPNGCDIDTNNRVRGYIYAGYYADIQGAIEWTLPDGTPAGGRLLCRRITALSGARIRYEEKPVARPIPGLNI